MPAELVTTGTGVLYDPRDPEALLGAMQRCCGLDLGAMGCMARQRVAGFTSEDMALRHLAIYADSNRFSIFARLHESLSCLGARKRRNA